MNDPLFLSMFTDKNIWSFYATLFTICNFCTYYMHGWCYKLLKMLNKNFIILTNSFSFGIDNPGALGFELTACLGQETR